MIDTLHSLDVLSLWSYIVPSYHIETKSLQCLMIQVLLCSVTIILSIVVLYKVSVITLVINISCMWLILC